MMMNTKNDTANEPNIVKNGAKTTLTLVSLKKSANPKYASNVNAILPAKIPVTYARVSCPIRRPLVRFKVLASEFEHEHRLRAGLVFCTDDLLAVG